MVSWWRLPERVEWMPKFFLWHWRETGRKTMGESTRNTVTICFIRRYQLKHGSTYPFILLGGDTGQLLLIINAADKPLKHLILRQEGFIKASWIEIKATLKSGQEMMSILFYRTSLRKVCDNDMNLHITNYYFSQTVLEYLVFNYLSFSTCLWSSRFRFSSSIRSKADAWSSMVNSGHRKLLKLLWQLMPSRDWVKLNNASHNIFTNV